MKRSFQARLAETPADVDAAQALRYAAFIAETGAAPRQDGRDADAYDDLCRHVLIEDAESADLAATFRLMLFTSGEDIAQSYSAQYYELDALTRYDKPMVEMGRFCIAPGQSDPDILRVAWGAVTAFVDREGAELLFGCSSFHGTDTRAYADAFAMLKERHLAPRRWLPRIKAPNVFRYAHRLRRAPDRKRALKTMPPLLRSYLNMGGWVSDHAVVDTDLNTLHVFTGLEVRAIPPARVRALRAVAG
ncbi:MAG: GNAT family N-acyltransferase [Pseudomonadota bacterium]